MSLSEEILIFRIRCCLYNKFICEEIVFFVENYFLIYMTINSYINLSYYRSDSSKFYFNVVNTTHNYINGLISSFILIIINIHINKIVSSCTGLILFVCRKCYKICFNRSVFKIFNKCWINRGNKQLRTVFKQIRFKLSNWNLTMSSFRSLKFFIISKQCLTLEVVRNWRIVINISTFQIPSYWGVATSWILSCSLLLKKISPISRYFGTSLVCLGLKFVFLPPYQSERLLLTFRTCELTNNYSCVALTAFANIQDFSFTEMFDPDSSNKMRLIIISSPKHRIYSKCS